MDDDRLILAVDIGTSGARAVVFDAAATYQTHVRVSYGMQYPQPGYSEQDPLAVAEAVLSALQAAIAQVQPPQRLAAVVLSAQLYSILALDAAYQPLTPSLTWGDMRAAALIPALHAAADVDLAQRTGCPLQALYPLAKIRWLRQQGTLPAAARFGAIKDYVVWRLCGTWVSDWSTASASGLLDIQRYAWDDAALALAGITAAQLPALASPRQQLTSWRPEVRQRIGLPAGVPLILGAGDAPLANIGVGAIAPGTLAVNLGTSAAARILVNQPIGDRAGRLWTYVADEGHWVMGGMIGSGGIIYDWLLRDLLWPERDAPTETLFAEADARAARIAPGADDLLFVPYFSGEQSPGWNAQAKGLLDGLTLRHTPDHVVRAAIEGLAFALRRAALPIDALRGAATRALYLTGGLASSPVWQRILADVFGAPVIVPASGESSARGAAILGWLALGAAQSYATFDRPVTPLLPDAATHALYAARYAAFVRLVEQRAVLDRMA